MGLAPQTIQDGRKYSSPERATATPRTAGYNYSGKELGWAGQTIRARDDGVENVWRGCIQEGAVLATIIDRKYRRPRDRPEENAVNKGEALLR